MSGHEADPSGDSLLEACRERLAEAERRYREAVQSHMEFVESGKDAAAIAATVERKSAARQEYHRLLRVFSDMVVRGKRPKG
jgi:hypothetical protein